MLQSYLKIALRTFTKNKLYTGVSLFGISFTLMVIMLALSYADSDLGAHPPITKKDQIVTIRTLIMKEWQRNTETKIDTLEENGIMTFDTTTTETINKEDHRSLSNSDMGEDFIKEFMMDLKTPEKVSLFRSYAQIDVFQDNEYLSFSTNYCDDVYFQIFDFPFIEGAPFTKNDVENALPVIVISKNGAKKYFGKKDSYLGEVIPYQGSNLKIVGVVDEVAGNMFKREIYMPYTRMADSELNNGWGYFGSLLTAYLLPSPSDKSKLSAEFRNLEAQLEGNLPDDFDEIQIVDKDINNDYAMALFWDTEKNTYWKLRSIFLGFLTLFILVPIMNLMNLNMNRIAKRSDEIGVRKAFGASTSQLISQFVLENLLLTFVGGLLGLLLTLLAIRWINHTEFLDGLRLTFFPGLFFSCFLIILLFGILSGFLPAWRSSRMPISQALKNS